MADERRIYDMTQEMLARLEAEGIEASEAAVVFCRATAEHLVEIGMRAPDSTPPDERLG